jgi:hypothetical protein
MAFQFLKVVTMWKAVFWAVAIRSLVEVYQCFRSASCIHYQVDETARMYHMLVTFYQTTQLITQYTSLAV